MKNQISRQLSFLLLIIVVSVSCTSKTNNGNAAARTKITENIPDGMVGAHAGFVDSLIHVEGVSVASGDLDAYMDLWADNAIRYTPGDTGITGKDNIRAVVAPLFKNYNLHETLNNKGTIRFGKWADIYGTFTFSMTPKEGGKTQTYEGKYSALLVKDHGAWKLYLDCGNYNGPPTVK